MLLITKSRELYCNFNVWLWAHDGAHTEQDGGVIAPFPHSVPEQGWNLPPSQLKAFLLSVLTLPTDAGWARSRRYLLKSGSVYFLPLSPSVLFEAAELLTARLTFCAFKGILGSCRKPGAGKKARRAPLQPRRRVLLRSPLSSHRSDGRGWGVPSPSPSPCTLTGDDRRWQMRSQKRIRSPPPPSKSDSCWRALFTRRAEPPHRSVARRCERRQHSAAPRAAESGAAPLAARGKTCGRRPKTARGSRELPHPQGNPRGRGLMGAEQHDVLPCLLCSPVPSSAPPPFRAWASLTPGSIDAARLSAALLSSLAVLCSPRTGQVLPGLVMQAVFPSRLSSLCKRGENADFFLSFFSPYFCQRASTRGEIFPSADKSFDIVMPNPSSQSF